MSLKKLTSAFLLVIVISLCAKNTALAQDAMPPAVDTPTPIVVQENYLWCWLAVAEMVLLQRDGTSLEQCEMLEAWDNLPEGLCCYDPIRCTRGGHGLTEIAQVIQHFSGLQSRPTISPIAQSALYELLQAGYLIIASRDNFDYTSHVVVIHGMRFVRDHSQESGWRAIIIINDPAFTAPQEFYYDDFIINWTSSLVIR